MLAANCALCLAGMTQYWIFRCVIPFFFRVLRNVSRETCSTMLKAITFSWSSSRVQLPNPPCNFDCLLSVFLCVDLCNVEARMTKNHAGAFNPKLDRLRIRNRGRIALWRNKLHPRNRVPSSNSFSNWNVAWLPHRKRVEQ
jgi:hypothetical protein